MIACLAEAEIGMKEGACRFEIVGVGVGVGVVGRSSSRFLPDQVN